MENPPPNAPIATTCCGMPVPKSSGLIRIVALGRTSFSGIWRSKWHAGLRLQLVSSVQGLGSRILLRISIVGLGVYHWARFLSDP